MLEGDSGWVRIVVGTSEEVLMQFSCVVMNAGVVLVYRKASSALNWQQSVLQRRGAVTIANRSTVINYDGMSHDGTVLGVLFTNVMPRSRSPKCLFTLCKK